VKFTPLVTIPAGHHDATRFVYFWAPPKMAVVAAADAAPSDLPAPVRWRE
jgi:hypothetical protein